MANNEEERMVTIFVNMGSYESNGCPCDWPDEFTLDPERAKEWGKNGYHIPEWTIDARKFFGEELYRKIYGTETKEDHEK